MRCRTLTTTATAVELPSAQRKAPAARWLCEDRRMEEHESVIALLNGLLGVYWTSYAQHQTHVALVDSWGLSGLARSMRDHIDDEPETIEGS